MKHTQLSTQSDTDQHVNHARIERRIHYLLQKYDTIKERKVRAKFKTGSYPFDDPSAYDDSFNLAW